MNGTVIKLAASNPICTHEQLAALEFEPSSEFVGFDKNPKAMEEHEEKLRSIGIMARFTIAILGKSKGELIDMVRSMDEHPDEEIDSISFHGYLTGAREKLEAMLAFVTAAECRFACAMANAYSEEAEKLPSIPKPPEPTLGRRRHRRDPD